jgi:hypothetical protein
MNGRSQEQLFELEPIARSGERVLLSPGMLAEASVVSGPDEAMGLRLELLLR